MQQRKQLESFVTTASGVLPEKTMKDLRGNFVEIEKDYELLMSSIAVVDKSILLNIDDWSKALGQTDQVLIDFLEKKYPELVAQYTVFLRRYTIIDPIEVQKFFYDCRLMDLAVKIFEYEEKDSDPNPQKTKNIVIVRNGRSADELVPAYKKEISECDNNTLVSLSFGNCDLSSLNEKHLQDLFSYIVSSFPYLRKLDFGFSHIGIFPLEICKLSNLAFLSFSFCGDIISIPDEIRKLSYLRYLNLIRCKGLTSISSFIGELSILEWLSLSAVEVDIKSIFSSIVECSHLQYLNLSDTNLSSLPADIIKLSQLQKLNVSNCKDLNSIGGYIIELPQLKELNIQGLLLDDEYILDILRDRKVEIIVC